MDFCCCCILLQAVRNLPYTHEILDPSPETATVEGLAFASPAQSLSEISGYPLPHRTEENRGSRSHKKQRQRHQSPLAERGDRGCVNFLDRDAEQPCLAHCYVRFEPELRRQVHDVWRV